MATRRKLTTEVVKTVTIEFVYRVSSDGIPSDAELRAELEAAVGNSAEIAAGEIAGIRTATRRVAAEG